MSQGPPSLCFAAWPRVAKAQRALKAPFQTESARPHPGTASKCKKLSLGGMAAGYYERGSPGGSAPAARKRLIQKRQQKSRSRAGKTCQNGLRMGVSAHPVVLWEDNR